MLTDFQHYFTGRLCCKFATNSIPPHLNYVAVVVVAAVLEITTPCPKTTKSTTVETTPGTTITKFLSG